MNTLSIKRVAAIWLLAASVFLGFALQTYAQETIEADVITSEVVTQSEVPPADIFVPAESTTTPDLPDIPVEEAPAPTYDEPASAITALLSTDKDDYHPGETATIFGRFFAPLENFILKIFGSDENDQNYTETETEVTTNDEGSFSFLYTLDSLYRPFYRVAVSTLGGEEVAKTWFRDSSLGTYDQCSNDLGIGYVSGDTGCRWTNGNIQSNNSKYFEGDSTVQRLWMKGYAPGSSHTITFKYGTTKGGSHAYDYLTTWNASENWITLADRCQDITGCTTATETTLAMQNDPNVTDTIEPAVASRLFTMRGGTITAVSVPAIVVGTYAGDSETSVTVTFTVANSGAMCDTKQGITSCDMALWFGAHVSLGSQWNSFNGTTGAGAIPGSPYHVALDAEDGTSIGQRDNQMQSAAIAPSGSITIVKNAVPDSAQDFAFTTTGTGLSSFSLDDDADNTLLNTKTFTGLTAGTYTVTEGVTAGWSLTGLTCADPTSNSTGNTGTRVASINLAAGETVTCTYTNTLQQGSVKIVKNTVGGNGTFAFTGNTGVTSLTTSANTANQTVNVNAGTYNIAEAVPAGWDLTSATCDNNSTPANIIVTAGQTTTCTFTNTKKGQLTVQKTTFPGGDTTSFAINATGNGTITGGGAGSVTDANDKTYEVTPGTYSVSETVPSGWTQTSNNCTSVAVAAGESKTCLITNTKKGSITIEKQVVGANKNFSFTGAIAASLGDNQTATLEVTPGNYSVTEGTDAAYALTSLTCNDSDSTGNTGTRTASFVVAAGEDVTCVFTNSELPKLTLVKTVVNNNGGGAVVNDFQGKINGNNVPWLQAQTLTAGSYAASETNLATYTASAWGGDCAGDGSVTLAYGDNKTCTITNDDKPGTLIVKKVITNDNGGTAKFENFSFVVNAGNAVSFETDGQNDMTVNAGTYSVTEPAATGYVTTYDNCSNLQIPNGGTATCTITNNDIQPKLTVTKVVINHGQTKSIADFPLFVDATGVTSGVQNGFNTGAHTVSETGDASYTSTITGDCDANGNITLTLADVKACTITNEEKLADITVKKVVINHGQNKSAADFAPYKVDTTTVTLDQATVFDSGNHTVSEVPDANYTQTFSGDCNASGVVALGSGEHKICTITNEEKLSKIIVEKEVKTHGGDADASDFGPYKVGTTEVVLDTATTFDSGSYVVTEVPSEDYTQTFSGACDPNGNVTLVPGTTVTCHILNEEKPAKLVVTKVVITDNGGTKVVSNFPLFVGTTGVTSGATNTFDSGPYTVSETGDANYTATISGDCDPTTGSVTLTPGETKSCTITNNDNAPKLTLVKEVVNDNGGKAIASDWTLTATGYDAQSPDAGTYTLSESNGPAGYTQTSLTCSDSGDTQVTSVTLGLGEEVTCTFVNNDIAPKLTVIKRVINDDGGDDLAASFTMNVTGTAVSSASFAGSEAGTTVTLDQGSYSVDEGTHTGYTKSLGTNCSGSINVGEEKTCTITNNDQPASITLTKVVTKNNGGNAGPNDFGLTIGGNAAVSGQSYDVDSNTIHALNEAGLAGYSFLSLTGDAKCPAALAGTVTLDEGEHVSCTITNDDIPAHLIVIKNVVNGDTGATTLASAFTTTITGVTTAIPSAPGVENPGVDNILTTVGSYSVDEGAHDGYTKSLLAGCTGTVALGETKTCVVTNTAIAPKLTLVKTVMNNNGGTKKVEEFTLSIDTAGVVSGEVNNTTVGAHTASEVSDPGYQASAWGGDCDDDGSITLALGDEKTCTITNDDKAPKLTLVKQVTNNNGGTAAATAWTLTATGLTTISGAGGTVSGATFSAGTYALSESTGPTGYAAGAWNCVGGTQNGESITLGLGQEATCTIINDDQPGKIVLVKNTVGGNNTFNFSIAGPSASAPSITTVSNTGTTEATVDAGSYSAAETVPAGWDLTSATCTSGTPQQLTVPNGGTVTCTFTNTKRGHLIVEKTTLPAGDTTSFSITVTGNGTISGSAAGVVTDATDKDYEVTPGTYSVAETVPTGWDKTGDTCQNVTVAAGETKTCLLTNTKRAKITIIKDASPNDVADFIFSSAVLGGFTLDDDAGVVDPASGEELNEWSNTKAFMNVLPGSLTVSEAQPNQYWKMKSVSCVDAGGQAYGATAGTNSVTLTLTPGVNVTCTFVNEKLSPTRTQGFWQTHTEYTSGRFTALFGAGMVIGSPTAKTILTNAQLFGAYYSSIPKKSDGKQRTALDKSRMQLLQQLVTAKLNCAAFGCTASVQTMISQADVAYSGTNASTILASASSLDLYNNSGDTIVIGNAGKATPKTSQSLANIIFWDIPKP